MQEKLEKGRTITGLSKSQQGEKEHTTHKKAGTISEGHFCRYFRPP